MRSGWTCAQVPVPSSAQGKLSRTVNVSEGVNGQMKLEEGPVLRYLAAKAVG